MAGHSSTIRMLSGVQHARWTVPLASMRGARISDKRPNTYEQLEDACRSTDRIMALSKKQHHSLQVARWMTQDTVRLQVEDTRYSQNTFALQTTITWTSSDHIQSIILHTILIIHVPSTSHLCATVLGALCHCNFVAAPLDQLEPTPLLKLNCVGLLEKNAICCSR